MEGVPRPRKGGEKGAQTVPGIVADGVGERFGREDTAGRRPGRDRLYTTKQGSGGAELACASYQGQRYTGTSRDSRGDSEATYG